MKRAPVEDALSMEDRLARLEDALAELAYRHALMFNQHGFATNLPHVVELMQEHLARKGQSPS